MVRATVSGDTGVRNVIIEGEVDISNIQEMRQPLEQIWNQQPIDFDVVIDLTKATYIDSAVLELIVRTRHRLASLDKKLTVITLQKTQPDRVLKTCRFDTILDFRSLDPKNLVTA